MKSPSVRYALFALGGLLLGTLAAVETVRPAERVVTGEVVDLSSYLIAGARGEATLKTRPAKGSSCAILTDDGQLILPLADAKAESTDLAPFLARRVRVRGTAYSKNAVTGLVITKLEPLAAEAAPTGK